MIPCPRLRRGPFAPLPAAGTPGRSPAALRAAKAGFACFAPASPGRAAPRTTPATP